MRILHTADWHLGKRLDTIPRLQEQKDVLEEITEIADTESPDLILIAGDIFDSYNPAVEAVELFYKTVKRLSGNGRRLVLAIAGNHDSPDRIEAPDPLARECGIILAGYPNTVVPLFSLDSGIAVVKNDGGFIEAKLPGFSYPIRIIFTPYANEQRLKTLLNPDNAEKEFVDLVTDRWKLMAEKYCDSDGVNLLTAHLYLQNKDEIPLEEPEEEKTILYPGGAQPIYSEYIPNQVQYVALGHMHRRQTVDKIPCPMVYSSSPLAYSFSETNQDKFVVIVEAEPHKPVVYKSIKLKKGKKLLRKTFSNISDAESWLKENIEAWVELTIVTDKFISAEEKKVLFDAHPGIVNIIPEVKNKEFLDKISCPPVDLTKNTEELFKEYFKFKHGSIPNERILQIFKEVLAEEDLND